MEISSVLLPPSSSTEALTVHPRPIPSAAMSKDTSPAEKNGGFHMAI